MFYKRKYTYIQGLGKDIDITGNCDFSHFPEYGNLTDLPTVRIFKIVICVHFTKSFLIILVFVLWKLCKVSLEWTDMLIT